MCEDSCFFHVGFVPLQRDQCSLFLRDTVHSLLFVQSRIIRYVLCRLFKIFVSDQGDSVNWPLVTNLLHLLSCQIRVAAKESGDAAGLGAVGVSRWEPHSA